MLGQVPTIYMHVEFAKRWLMAHLETSRPGRPQPASSSAAWGVAAVKSMVFILTVSL